MFHTNLQPFRIMLVAKALPGDEGSRSMSSVCPLQTGKVSYGKKKMSWSHYCSLKCLQSSCVEELLMPAEVF